MISVKWKDAVGFEGFYQVSNAGDIRSVDRMVRTNAKVGTYRKHKGRVLNPRADRDGYLITDFWVHGVKTTVKIHRLVLIAFEGEKDGFVTDHRNGARDDNRLENLRWLTPADNRRNITAVRAASGVRGVRAGRNGNWQAYDGGAHSLGTFPTIKEAAHARSVWESENYV